MLYLDHLQKYRPTRSVGKTNTPIDDILNNDIDELKKVMQGSFVTDVSDDNPNYYITCI